MNEERTSFAAASGNVCKRELLQSTDAAAERPAHKCFDLLADWAEESKSSLRLATEEMHTAYYSMLNEAFVLLMKSASKDEGDPTAIYDKELKEIRKRFPVTAPAMQKINQPFVTLLEGAAKKVSEFNRK